jgi:glycosyltransferase involved in cell wall biosynthesis
MFFSILTACYNQEKTLKATLDSCLNQTFSDYEIIISDDNSHDGSMNIIHGYNDPKIRKFRQNENLKEYPNRNFLVEQARGEYIIFVDAEDILYPHALEVFAYYLSRFPEVAMLITNKWDPRIIYPLKLSPRELYQFAFLDAGVFFGVNFTNIVFKTEAVKQVGLFPTNVRSGDTYMQFKLSLKEPALIISDGQAWWRKSAGNVTEKLNPHYSAKDYCHLASAMQYRIEMLNSPDCPLTAEEIKIAKQNIYGTTLRFVCRWLLRLKFMKIYYLFKRIHIPSNYYYSLFTRGKHGFFNNYSGDNPMHTTLAK